jgi:DNA-binding transcriptional ArsR family regulator
MPDINKLGDVEITDPQAMRLLADPDRLALLERLQGHGAASAQQLARELEAPPLVISEQLRELETVGLVGATGEDLWEARGTGIRFEPADDAESQAAYRELSRTLFLRLDELPRRWLAEAEPELEPQWRRVSGFANARIVITQEEAAELDAQMEELLVPFVARDRAEQPDGARPVRLLRFLMPEREP